jgi:WD40 repeat protein/serine/threonine protein kinase
MPDSLPPSTGLSQFYTSSLGLASDVKRPQKELLAEALVVGKAAWSEGSRYRIDDAIAAGGMGAILKAWDNEAERHVAMKVMLRDDLESSASRRFIREAQVVAQLEHPNIIPVHEIGISMLGDPYFTMKWVQGDTLADILYRIRKRDAVMCARYPLPVLLDIFLKIIDAVAFAHSRQILHLDLKPHNILIGPFGEVMVLDWGLAQMLNVPASEPWWDSEDRLPATSQLITRDGLVKGTPGYMPPEQAKGQTAELDCRADVFSLGAILYTMLTFKCPVVGDNRTEMLDYTITGEFERPGKRAQAPVPKALEAVVMKALERDREDRYESVGALHTEIWSYLEGRATSAENPGIFTHLKLFMQRFRTEVSLIGASILVTTLLVAVFVLRLNVEREQTSELRRTTQSREEAAEFAASDAAHQRELAERRQRELSAMRKIAGFQDYLASIRHARLCMAETRYDQARQALAACGDKHRHWEWQRLAFLASLAKDTLDLHRPITRASCSSGPHRAALLLGDQDIAIIDLESMSEIHRIRETATTVADIAINADGSLLATAGADNSARLWDIAEGSQIRLLVGHREPITAIVFSPDGQSIFTGSGDRSVIQWSTRSGRLERSYRGHRAAISALAVSANGNVLLTGSSDRQAILWSTRNGRLVDALRGHKHAVTAVALHHSGAVATGTQAGQIHRWQLSGGQLRDVFDAHDGAITDLRFTANGNALCSASEDNTATLWPLHEGSPRYLRGHGGPVRAILPGSSSQPLQTVSDDGKLKTWGVASTRETTTLRPHSGAVRGLLRLPNGLISVGDRNLHRFASPNAELPALPAPARAMARIADEALLTLDSKGALRRWDLAANRQTDFSVDSPAKFLAVGGPGPLLITAAGNSVTLHDIDGVYRDSISGESRVTALIADSALLGIGRADGSWQVLRLPSRALVAESAIPGASVSALGFCDDQFAIGRSDGQLDLHSYTRGMISTLAHSASITAFQASEDGQRLFSAGRDGTVRVWETFSLSELMSMDVRHATITALSFTKGQLAAGTSDGRVLEWPVSATTRNPQ